MIVGKAKLSLIIILVAVTLESIVRYEFKIGGSVEEIRNTFS